MGDIAWEYPIVFILAIAGAGFMFNLIVRQGRVPPPKEFERECTRCKLKVVGKAAESFLYCPFCAQKY